MPPLPPDQAHILDGWEALSPEQQQHLAIQIARIDIPRLREQQALLKKGPSPPTHLEPVPRPDPLPETPPKKMGCLIVAGGQGTRLGFPGPKGAYEINGKSLFQYILENIPPEHHDAPIAIMTSPFNHDATVQFFKEKNYFGFVKEQITFFSQGMLPFLDDGGNLLLERPDTIAEGADGNGTTLHQFVASGTWEKWRALGIEAVQFVPVDNPLVHPYSLPAMGDVTMHYILREDPAENVGVIAKKEGRIVVTEYTELPEHERIARLPDGRLKFPLANISRFCFSMPFIAKAAKETLPLHLVHKKVQHLGKECLAWKSETFIFDLLPLAEQLSPIETDRSCFVPCKGKVDAKNLSLLFNK